MAPDPQILESLFHRAMQLVKNGQLEAAVAEFKKLRTLIPDQAAIHFNLGNALRGMGRNEEAATCFQCAIDLAPEDPQAHFNLGNTLAALERVDNAIISLERAATIAPTFAAAQFNLGNLLLDSGEHLSAANRFHAVIKLIPGHFRAHLNLGRALKLAGDDKQAVAVLCAAFPLTPEHADDWVDLGNTLFELYRFDDAGCAYQKAVDMSGENAHYLYNLGNAYYRQQRYNEAADILRRAAELAPTHSAIFYNLGNTYQQMGKLDLAVDCFRKTCLLDPQNEEAAHMLAAMSGQTTRSAPKAWIRRLFDQYSDRFDQHIVEDLGYTVPEQLADALKDATGPSAIFQNALDLGCGTGISGLAFRAITRRLVGIDLSPKMVAAARGKNIYNHLQKCGIIEYLTATAETFDLVIATDVLIYIGEATELFDWIGRRTLNAACFVLSTESATEADYVLRPTGRYAHSNEYIRRLAGQSGFGIRMCQPARIRKEKGQWIMGSLFVLQKQADKSPRTETR